MSKIISHGNPPFPVIQEMICVFLVLSDCQGKGRGQIRIAFVDDEPEQPVFTTPEHEIDFSSVGRLETIGVKFRIRGCPFARPGQYMVQFWYNGVKIKERPLRLRG